ncbi:hypothetical protein M9H77_23965 [Catharanthus roseus]|uniref:Uncharacterized protein n=1 Tax=Catharanthus roseus TaxID=4058 RepID=A0ACC0AW07_CATRO|nr:hypothetical protein M9H77_23965 [Catharanthus roseus]
MIFISNLEWVRARKKVSSEADNLADDRISNLPDYILCLTLSFIPTIEYIRTSVLSTRWKCLWTRVSTIILTIMLLTVHSESSVVATRFKLIFQSHLGKPYDSWTTVPLYLRQFETYGLLSSR